MTRAGRGLREGTTAERSAPGRNGRRGGVPASGPLDVRVVNPQALQAGIALVQQQRQSAARAEAFRGVTAKALARELDISGMHPLLQEQQERWQRLAAIADPCRGVLEAFRNQTSAVERIAEAHTESLRRMAEALTPSFPAIELGLGFGFDTTSALAAAAGFSSLGGLRDSVRIHAVPRVAIPGARRPGQSREEVPDRATCPARPDVEDQVIPGLEDSLDDDDTEKLLKQLSRFQRSDEISSDAREGMEVMLTWWKLRRSKISRAESREFNLTVQGFLRSQLGVTTDSDGFHKLESGLLLKVSKDREAPPVVDLDPRIYTSVELAEILNYNDSTIRRHAEIAWTKCGGRGPCRLRTGSEWYVVEAPEPGGGQKRGWKFQRLREFDPA